MKVENIFVSVVFEIEIMQRLIQNHSCFILSVCKMLKIFFVFVNTEKTNLPCGPYAIINLLQNCICSKKFHIILFRAYVSRKLTKRLTQNLSFSKSLRKSREEENPSHSTNTVLKLRTFSTTKILCEIKSKNAFLTFLKPLRLCILILIDFSTKNCPRIENPGPLILV